MQLKTIEKKDASYKFLFSICTIVTSMEEYAEAKQSFEACGFTENCEYLVADNTLGNQFSAYEAIAAFIKRSSGQYLIIVHQDVRCIDNKEMLTACLSELTQLDRNWAVCGNAGNLGYREKRYYINNAGEEIITHGLPARVSCLDENMLIINRDTNLTISADLDGFHLYGSDLCLVADFLGYSCYVIPFMVKHLSPGNIDELKLHREKFISQYGKKLRGRFIETTCINFYLSNSAWKNKMFNSPFFFRFVKLSQKLLFKYRRIFFKPLNFKTVKRKVGSQPLTLNHTTSLKGFLQPVNESRR